VLDSAAGALLGNFLSDTLLVHATVDNSPVDLARVQTLLEVGFALTVEETERLYGEGKRLVRSSWYIGVKGHVQSSRHAERGC